MANIPTTEGQAEQAPRNVTAKDIHFTADGKGVALSLFLVLLGGTFQGWANGTADAVLLAFLLLLIGSGISRLVFQRSANETRAFLFTYSICVLAGGLGQWYSTVSFGAPQSTTDAIGFFGVVFPRPPYFSLEELTLVGIEGEPAGRGAPLAVAIWQWIYRLRFLLALDYGLYIGVMFNAFIMGLTGSITVRTARELFGDDSWRLQRVGTLFAFCGLFILFGAVLIRDCFTTILNALVLWGIVRWLMSPTSRNVLTAGALSAFCVGAMMFLRSRSIVLFGFYWFLAFCTWFLARRLNTARIAAAMALLALMVAGYSYLTDYIATSRALQIRGIEAYEVILATASQEDSLGMKIVVNQPLPIRLVLGTASLLVFPIPLWAYFREGVGEYHLLKGYNGLYQLFLVPLVFAGMSRLMTIANPNRRQYAVLLFLVIYLSVNVLAVVATSLEQRHLAQFLPASMILAALPDTRNRSERNTVRVIGFFWLVVVVFVHVAWAIATMGR